MTRAEIKFSEETGDNTKKALSRYRDKQELDSYEEAVRDLLPDWALSEERPDTLVLGEPVGLETPIISLNEQSIDFSQSGRLEIPFEDSWEIMQIDLSELDSDRMVVIELFLRSSKEESNPWPPVRYDMPQLQKGLNTITFWRDIPDTGKLSTISIPRKRLEHQFQLLEKAVEKEVEDDTAEETADLRNKYAEIQKAMKRAGLRRELHEQRNEIESKIKDLLPELTQARSTAEELDQLSRVESALDSSRIQFTKA